MTVERRSQYLIVTFPEQILFDSGLSRLKPSVGPLLEKVSRFIQDHPGISTEIHGHTDDRPIHNQRYPSNWELSADRAAQVAKALVEQGTLRSGSPSRASGNTNPSRPTTATSVG